MLRADCWCARRGGDVLQLQQGGPSRGRLLELAGSTEGEREGEAGSEEGRHAQEGCEGVCSWRRLQDRVQQRVIEHVVNVQVPPVVDTTGMFPRKSSRKRCRERSQHTTKHVVHTAKVEQPRSTRSTCRGKNPSRESQLYEPASPVHRGVEEIQQHHNECEERETRSNQRSNSSPNAPRARRGSTLQGDRCASCVTQADSKSPIHPEKTVEGYQAAIHRQSCRHLRASKVHKYSRTTSSLMCEFPPNFRT